MRHERPHCTPDHEAWQCMDIRATAAMKEVAKIVDVLARGLVIPEEALSKVLEIAVGTFDE